MPRDYYSPLHLNLIAHAITIKETQCNHISTKMNMLIPNFSCYFIMLNYIPKQ